MMGSSKVDQRIKETIVEFTVNRLIDDTDNEEGEPHPQKTSSGAVHREPAKPMKNLSLGGHIQVTSCSYIFTTGISKDK